MNTIANNTWRTVASRHLYLWVDRVSTHDNPTDGLSRGDFSAHGEQWAFQRAMLPELFLGLRPPLLSLSLSRFQTHKSEDKASRVEKQEVESSEDFLGVVFRFLTKTPDQTTPGAHTRF